ncbi:hypothetical protein AMJ80_08535 [bacterium SM23_31]|nr:MAG: hypothetical protein AMJ80_08535 [bacterium SM23_31]
MKKITILVSLIVFTGITVIVPLLGTKVKTCYAQVLLERVKIDKKIILKHLAKIKDESRYKGDNKLDDRLQDFWALPQWDLSETYSEIAETLADIIENETDDIVRALAAEMFRVLSDYRDSLDIKVIQTLEKALNDEAAKVKLEAAGALIRLNSYKENMAYSVLEDFVRGKDIEKWNAEATKPRDWPELYNEENAKRGYRITAIKHIAFVNTPETKALLVEMTKDSNESIRKWALKALKDHFIKK